MSSCSVALVSYFPDSQNVPFFPHTSYLHFVPFVSMVNLNCTVKKNKVCFFSSTGTKSPQLQNNSNKIMQMKCLHRWSGVVQCSSGATDEPSGLSCLPERLSLWWSHHPQVRRDHFLICFLILSLSPCTSLRFPPSFTIAFPSHVGARYHGKHKDRVGGEWVWVFYC